MQTEFPILVAVWLLACSMAAPVEAQSTTSAPGAVRGVFGADGPVGPARTTQQLSAWFDVGGGFDENVNAANGSGASEVRTRGTATTATASMRLWHGRTTRSIEANARVFRNNQRSGGSTATGGEVNLIGGVSGRRGGLHVALRGANESALLFGAIASPGSPTSTAPAVDTQIAVPDVSPQQGIVNARWYAVGGSTSGERDWSPRQRTIVQYSQLQRRPTEGNGEESDQRVAGLRHDWMPRLTAGLFATYRQERVEQTLREALRTEPVRIQTAEAGGRYERRYSPIRAFATTVQVGAAHVLASPAALGVDGALEPTGSVTASYTLTRRWAVVGSAMRSLTILQGVSQTPFSIDVASLSINGVMARRVTLFVSGSVSKGSALNSGQGAFDAVGGSAALRYGFRYGGLFVGYTRYEHHLRELASANRSIPLRFNQSSLRLGVTLWLPLYGAF